MSCICDKGPALGLLIPSDYQPVILIWASVPVCPWQRKEVPCLPVFGGKLKLSWSRILVCAQAQDVAHLDGVRWPQPEIQTWWVNRRTYEYGEGLPTDSWTFSIVSKKFLQDLKLAILSEKKKKEIVFPFVAKLQRHLLVRWDSIAPTNRVRYFVKVT